MSILHHRGPILGDDRAGPLRGLPMEIALAFPQDGNSVLWFNDFLNDADYDATNNWTATIIAAGSTVALVADAADTEGLGLLQFDNDAVDEGHILQLDHRVVLHAAATAALRPSQAAMGARFSLADANATDIFIGLAELNATSAVITAAGALTSDNHAGFHKLSAATELTFSAAGTTTASALTTVTTSPTLANGGVNTGFVDVAIYVEGENLARGYINGVRVAEISTTTPWDGALLLTLASVAALAGDDMFVDYVWHAHRRNLIR